MDNFNLTAMFNSSITLADNGTQIEPANVMPGSTGVGLHRFQLSVATANATLNGINFTSAGTYSATDISNFKVYYSTDATLDGGDTLLGTISTGLGAGTHTLGSLSQTINAGTTGYCFITTDISPGATVGNTINVQALTTSDLTFAFGTKSGSTTAGGLQTIINSGCTQPEVSGPSSAARCVGDAVTFTVTASGVGNLHYDWRKNGVSLGAADQNTYTIASVVSGDAGNYTCVVTDDDNAGCPTTSSSATLTVNTPPILTTDTIAQTVCGGSSASFTVASSGTGFTYTWRLNGTPIADGPTGNGSTYTGQGTAMLTISSAAMADAVEAGAGFDCVIAGAVPCGSVTSTRVALTVVEPPTISVQPTAQATCVGSSASFSVTATGAGITYTWRKNGVAISNGDTGNGSTFSGQGTPTLTITGAALADTATAGAGFDCVVTGTSPCTAATSTRVAFTVNSFTLASRTLAAQGFETSGGTWPFTFASGAYNSETGSADTPPNSRILSGTRSWFVNNRDSTLTFASLVTASYQSIAITVRVASISVTSGNGADSADQVWLYVATNGQAFPTTPDLILAGPSADNARWSFTTGTGVAQTMAGTSAMFYPIEGGPRTNDGYSTLVVTVPDGSTNVALRIVAMNNSTSEIWAIDDVTISGQPVNPAQAVIAGPTTVCAGGSATLSANIGAASYLWSPGGETTQSITVSPASTTAYSVTITDANGCASTANQTVTVNAPGTVNAGSDQTIQSGSSAALAGSFGGGAPGVLWSGGSGSFAPDANDPNATYTPSASEISAGTVTLTLTATPSAPCPTVTDTMIITINRPPTTGNASYTRGYGLTYKIAIADLLALCSDPDAGDTISFVSAAHGAHGTVQHNATHILYTPNSGNNSADTFTYTVQDARGGSAQGSIGLAVSGQPVGTAQSLSVSGGQVTVIFDALRSLHFAVERADSASGPWSTLEGYADVTADTASKITVNDSPPAEWSQAYYRLRWLGN